MIEKFDANQRASHAGRKIPAGGVVRLAVVALIAMASSACSDRQVYDSLQAQQRSRCVNEPAVRYDECMRQAGPDYAEYEQKRNEARDDNGR
ncbi:hypothetical protein [Elongatibacter sediminis]|uniref:Lipoprotein n=1 Tax=Elongatibacter sediminis TaxID=3119006 RepID=A0AAW9RGF3_9GAMM